MTRQVAAASELLRLAKTTDAAAEPVEESQYKCSIKPTSAAAAPPPTPPLYTEFHQKRRTSKAETTNTTATTCHRLFHQSRRLRQANLEINNDTRSI